MIYPTQFNVAGLHVAQSCRIPSHVFILERNIVIRLHYALFCETRDLFVFWGHNSVCLGYIHRHMHWSTLTQVLMTYVYGCTHRHGHIYTQARTHTCTRTHAHTHIHTLTHAHTRTQTHTHAHTHTHTHTLTRTHTHTHTHVSVLLLTDMSISRHRGSCVKFSKLSLMRFLPNENGGTAKHSS